MGLGSPFGFDGGARACRRKHQLGGRVRGTDPDENGQQRRLPINHATLKDSR
jgi:hypothetical protein